MDFLVSQRRFPKVLRKRYGAVHRAAGFQVGVCKNPNVASVFIRSRFAGVITGSLRGPMSRLRDGELRSPEELCRWAQQCDGSFAVLLVEGARLTVLTDVGSSIPVYWGIGPSGLAVGTLSHHAARASGLMNLDRVSAVDFLLHDTICAPYAWFEGMQVLPPGTVSLLSADGIRHHPYWRPVEPADFDSACDARSWGRCLRGSVQGTIRAAVSKHEKGRVLYSGGADSRAVLSSMPSDFPCIPTMIVDQRRREYRIAATSARLLGRRVEAVHRPKKYYSTAIAERLDLIGPGRDTRHVHVFGSIARSISDADVIFGGYGADALFKTFYMSNTLNPRGRPERLEKHDPHAVRRPRFRSDGRLSAPFRPDLVAEVRARRERHHAQLLEFRPRTAGNWHSLWPLGHLRAFSHYLSLLRLDSLIVEPFLHSSAYRVAARMPDTSRVDGRAFRKAFVAEMGLAGFWPTSSGAIPRAGGILGSSIRSTLVRWRILEAAFRREPVQQRSWPLEQKGWQPVVPNEHFSRNMSALLTSRLAQVLPVGERPEEFFVRIDVPSGMKVRALSLGFPRP